jgi:integrase/recombinase XerD
MNDRPRAIDRASVYRAFGLEQFGDYLSYERGLSQRTVAAYKRDLERCADFLADAGIREPSEVSPSELRGWVFALHDRGLAAASIRRAQSAVRTYFSFLIEEGKLATNPAHRLQSPKLGRRLPDFLTTRETTRLLDAPDPASPLYWRDRAILELLYASGVRVSELVGLRLFRVDFDDSFITVFGKGAKERMVPVGRPAMRAMERYTREVRPRLDRGAGEGRLYLNARGRPLRRESVWRLVRDSGRRAGLEKRVTPHTLRHTFATHLVEGGADLAAVQELLGHVDISSTQIYTHLDRDYLRGVHAKYHPRG